MKDMTFQVEKNGFTKEYSIYKYVNNPENNKNYLFYYDDNPYILYPASFTIEKGELVIDEDLKDDEYDYLERLILLEDEDV